MGVFTAPLAIMKIGTQVVGKMKNLRVNENFQRGRVIGVGNVRASEVPLTGFTGTVNSSFYVVDLRVHPFTEVGGGNAINRNTGDAQTMINTMVLNEVGFSLDIYQKEALTVNGDGVVTGVNETKIFASINQMFITSDSFDITEGQLAGRDGTFEFLEPVNYALRAIQDVFVDQ